MEVQLVTLGCGDGRRKELQTVFADGDADVSRGGKGQD